ncbi:MAG TPA: PTS mannitol transporter subunit IICBA [Propioniciclava sp.]|jgi:mannitol PTS system EIICBA or EIICB component|uniref:PTS mannitol transporter subunit IICBA n=1 Tax=Propioniciclava sp. TaxID=2038686 RepID=UPI002BFCF2E5|nr:PTS mannitol transporter subunit IICBA [Propioniciclava sp.]HRL49309.1 PTS mannitol transporter subunit IICBA [Propioniciclava sp.]HRL79017.1 PTS mannitol transporter subunit IICBA [Propioniciclava sp.]
MTLPDARVNKNLQGPGLRAQVQRIGGYLAGMIMPNIGAFIAWGLITALFIKTGWLPNATFAQLVDPMLYYLLPLLIGYTGGRMVHAQRGAVIGAIASAGVIIGGLPNVPEFTGGTPMFLGAMIMGPLAAFILKLFDKAVDGKIPSGFEMLVDNFSLGIIGLLLVLVGVVGVGPILAVIVGFLGAGVQILVNAGLLPLASIFVEPAKVLFLNNAINHGIFTPLAAIDVQTAGKSILFMVESNPGAGLGLLLAFMFFGPKSLRPATPGAIIIHFFGGIHEIYFPYVLMKPIMILATIAGSMSGLFVATWLNAGLVAAASPGSIIAYFLVTPPNGYVAMIATVATATIVSFVVASALLKFGRGQDDTDSAVADDTVTTMGHDLLATPGASAVAGPGTINGADIKRVVIACDAGMGSSVMVASQMKKRLSPYGVQVTHTPVDSIPADAQVVLTQDGLVNRATATAPHAVVVPFANYMGDPSFERVETAVKEHRLLSATGLGAPTGDAPQTSAAPEASAAPKKRKKTLDAGVLPRGNVRLGLQARDKEDAIRQAGAVLVSGGAADPGYIDGMLARELQTSTFLGAGVSIPHGTNEARAHIKAAALGFLQFPGGIDWDGQTAYVVIPIASNSDEHIGILSALASTLADKTKSEKLRTVTSVDEVLDLLTPEEEE